MRHGCHRGDCKVRIWDLLKLPNTKIHKCKVHDIAEIIQILDLCILVTHYWNFSKSKGHNCAEIIRLETKFKTQPEYSRDTSINWISIQKCQFVMEIMRRGNWKLMEFSKSKGHNSAENYSTIPKFKLNLRILVAHIYTQISIQNVNL